MKKILIGSALILLVVIYFTFGYIVTMFSIILKVLLLIGLFGLLGFVLGYFSKNPKN